MKSTCLLLTALLGFGVTVPLIGAGAIAASNDSSRASSDASAAAKPAQFQPGSGQTPEQAQALLKQYQALRDQLLDERRQAFLKAGTAKDESARRKIFEELHAAQKDRLAQLWQLHGQARAAEKLQQPEQRRGPTSPGAQ